MMQAIKTSQLKLLTKNNRVIKVRYFLDRDGNLNIDIFRDEKLLNSFTFPDRVVPNFPLMLNVTYGKTMFNSYINVLCKRDVIFKEVNCKDSTFDPIVKVIK